VALIATLAIAQGAVAKKAPRDFFGVDPQAPLTADDYDRMGKAKVGTLRFEIFWASANPADGVFNWNAVDAVVKQAAENDLRLLPFVYSTPQWVAELDGRNCDPAECLAFAPQGPEALAALKQFLKAAAERYGPGGTFWTLNPLLPDNPIREWQMFNEQNSPSFYKPKPNVKKYAKLLEAADEALAEVDPSAEVILGGMFGTPLGGRKPGIASWEYLEKLYDVKGAKKHFDGVAPHPYANSMSKVKAQVELMRDAMKKGGDRKAELWVTEVGWASGGPKHPLNKGKRGQAAKLKELFDFFLKKRRSWNVQTVDWYSWRDNEDTNAGLCAWCPFSGLLKENMKAKPSLKAFVKYTGGS
jgi:GH35 family endo-1,4-beta-xylanase